MTVFGGTFVLFAAALGTWCYFAFVGYPKEIQRLSSGEYSVVVFVEPTSRLNPLLMFGALYNNTSINVALFQDREKLHVVQFLKNQDRPEYHLPLEATWGATGVEVKEPVEGRTVFMAFPVSGT